MARMQLTQNTATVSWSGFLNSDPKSLMLNAVNIAGIVRNALKLLGSPLFWEQGAAGSNPAAPTN